MASRVRSLERIHCGIPNRAKASQRSDVFADLANASRQAVPVVPRRPPPSSPPRRPLIRGYGDWPPKFETRPEKLGD